MTETLLHIGSASRGERWQEILPALVPGLAVRQWPDCGNLEDVRYLAAWTPDAKLFASLPNLQLVFSVGAGVDQLDPAAIPPHVPLIRMIEPGLVQNMIEYAVFAVLALHRDMLVYINRQQAGDWTPLAPRPASSRRIGILGLGAMGGAIASRLVSFGFPVAGWSRSLHQIEGVETFAGMEALSRFLTGIEILICALPLTPDTKEIINAELLALLPEGAFLINIGRGGHVDEPALLNAIDAGHIAGAILDVAQQEPLPPGHRFWTDPRILMTPHIAGTTDADGGARSIAANILRHRAGQPLSDVVDRNRGY